MKSLLHVIVLIASIAMAIGLLSSSTSSQPLPGTLPLTKRVHIFYYLWYGNPEIDQKYLHWNHEVLPHWEARISSMYSNIGSRHKPPEDIHAPYYPLRGLYSSSDESIIQQHMRELIASGVEVMVVSWWGRPGHEGTADTQGVNTGHLVRKVLDCAESINRAAIEMGSKGISVAFHLEPYKSRSIESIREDLRYIHEKYGHYISVYREFGKVVFYVYDSYHLPPGEWGRLLTKNGEISVRGTELDGFFFGLWLEQWHGHDISVGGFDGAYSYFASSSVSYGSSPDNWRHMCSYCRKKSIACSLSVGPGYIDTGIRPWNFHATKERGKGNYYGASWDYAIRSNPDVVSITSYNEWGEGTQIEPALVAIPFHSNKRYLTYGDEPEDAYLYTNLTLKNSKLFREAIEGRPKKPEPEL